MFDFALLGAWFVAALGRCLFGTTLGLRLQRFSLDFPFGNHCTNSVRAADQVRAKLGLAAGAGFD